MRQSIALASLNEGVTPSRLGMSMTISEAAATLGRLGGKSKSPAKVQAARTNGKLGGRRKITNAQIERFADKLVNEWRTLASK
jgi:hypothetical protein